MNAYQGDQPFIFVSYAHADRDRVYPIIELLQEHGYHVWYDEGLHVGNDWREELADRISRCHVFIYMLTQRSAKSEFCKEEIYAAKDEANRREFSSADDESLKFITIKLEETEVSKGVMLAIGSRQWVIATTSSTDKITDELIQSPGFEICKEADEYVEGIHWGPKREALYFGERPDHVVFNSVMDNPLYGDEQHFLTMKGFSPHKQPHLVELQPGQTYRFRLFYCNDADPHMNASGKGVAVECLARIRKPDILEPGKVEAIRAELYAFNAKPQTIWDQISVCCKEKVELRFAPATAVYHNFGKLNDQLAGQQLFGDGVLLGFNTQSGKLPGGQHFRGTITFDLEVIVPQKPEFSQVVSQNGRDYEKKVSVLPGDILTFRSSFLMNQSAPVSPLVLRDRLPEGLDLIPGTTILYNEANPEGLVMKDFVTKNGFNVGSYYRGTHAVIQYKAKVSEDIRETKELVCRSFADYKYKDTEKYDELSDSVTCYVHV